MANPEIPFSDLSAQYATIKSEIDEAILRVISENAYIRGPYVNVFERQFAEFCDAKHCIGVGNGTDALFLILKALEIGPGDEVLVPAMTFIATSEAVSMAGAKPVFVDVDSDTYTIDPVDIERKVTLKTKAVIPVHLYGHPANMKRIREISDRHNLKVIQDSAQAHGAEIDGKPLIKYGDYLCFSFYPGKNLGAYGDAGAVVMNDDSMAEQIKMLSNHGRKSKYDHKFEGINSRMDGIQGAVLSIKLKRLTYWTQLRRNWASIYENILGGIKAITIPKTCFNSKHVYHLYTILAEDRDDLKKHLSSCGMCTGMHYPAALPFLQAYSKLDHVPADFPNAYKIQNQTLSIPMFPELGEKRALSVGRAIQNYYKNGT